MSTYQPKYLRRTTAAKYVRDTWGLPCSPKWLAKLAVTGGGPVFYKSGRYPLYRIDDLNSWANSRIAGRWQSTSVPCPDVDPQ